MPGAAFYVTKGGGAIRYWVLLKVRININHTVDYMARGFMSFMRGVDITRAIGRVGLKVKPVLGPEIIKLIKPNAI